MLDRGDLLPARASRMFWRGMAVGIVCGLLLGISIGLGIGMTV